MSLSLGTRAKNGLTTRADGRQFFTVRDQAGPIDSNPLACVRTRFPGEPPQFVAPLVHGLRELPTQSCRPHCKRQMDALALGNKRLKRTQDPLFVNGFEPSCHDRFIVQVGDIVSPRCFSGAVGNFVFDIWPGAVRPAKRPCLIATLSIAENGSLDGRSESEPRLILAMPISWKGPLQQYAGPKSLISRNPALRSSKREAAAATTPKD